jgi:hypothetical protein
VALKALMEAPHGQRMDKRAAAARSARWCWRRTKGIAVSIAIDLFAEVSHVDDQHSSYCLCIFNGTCLSAHIAQHSMMK